MVLQRTPVFFGFCEAKMNFPYGNSRKIGTKTSRGESRKGDRRSRFPFAKTVLGSAKDGFPKDVAQTVGFEPTVLFTAQTISRGNFKVKSLYISM